MSIEQNARLDNVLHPPLVDQVDVMWNLMDLPLDKYRVTQYHAITQPLNPNVGMWWRVMGQSNHRLVRKLLGLM